ncbi:MAG: FeoB-associated Cys-rich membrane protein [Spirochaetaceae bacterium]|jgi:hypothetical protein|nr:FeoB-associated Cys-rich membrane protein [Spirochaetaceae bacterium]
MAFIRANLSTIIVAVIVFGALGFICFRLIRNFRQGKSPCGCDKCRAAGRPAGS